MSASLFVSVNPGCRGRGDIPHIVHAGPARSQTNLLEFEVFEVVPVKTEETFHNYLRRHFERISKGNARRLAEQEAPKADVVPDTRSSDGSGSSSD